MTCRWLLFCAVLPGCVGGVIGSIPTLVQVHRDMQRIERRLSNLEARSRETSAKIKALQVPQ